MSDKKPKVEANEASTFSTAPEKNIDLADTHAEAISDLVGSDSERTHSQSTVVDSTEDNDAKDKNIQVDNTQSNNPLHGVKLQTIVEDLEAQYGWDGLAYRININCFKSDPSIKSSLKFLRRTPWARDKVERLYIKTFHKKYRPESY